MTQARAPGWCKLPNALQIPAILVTVVRQSGEQALFGATEVLALQFEILPDRIAPGGPFPDKVHNSEVTVAGK